MDRFQPGAPPPGAPPPQGGPPTTFAAYLGQRSPQLMQQIGQALTGGGQGGPPPMGGPPGMGAPGGMPPVGGPPPMMGGGMPPQAQQMAMQDPMYLAGQAAARMMAGRGLPGAGGPPVAPPGGMPPMGGSPGMPPR
jgi:hypothetical protein